MNTREIENLMQQDSSTLFQYFCGNKTYLNVPMQLIMNKVIPLTLGNSILFDSDSEEIVNYLNEWSEKYKLYEKCKLVLAQSSLLGKSMFFLLKNKIGDLDIYVPDYTMMSSVAKVNEIDKLAVIWTNLNKSDSASLAKITFTEGRCVIEYYSSPEDIRAQDATKYEKELTPTGQPIEIELEENFFPVFEYVNKRLPSFGFKNNTYFSGTPDWWNGRKLLFDIEDALEQKYKERKKNQTRVFGDMSEDVLDDIKKRQKSGQGVDIDDFISDFVIRASVNGYNTGGGNDIAVLQGDPKLEAYHSDINQTLNMFFETCGYNRQDKDNANYENKSKSIMNNDLDIQTTSIKQKELVDGLYRLIDIVLFNKGIEYKKNGVRNYSIKFTSSSIVEKIQKLELLKTRLEMKTISRNEVIRELDNVNKLVAEEKLKEIDEDSMNMAAMEQAFNSDDENSENEDNSSMNKEVI